MGGKGINMPIYLHSLLLGGAFFILGYFCFISLENKAVERT